MRNAFFILASGAMLLSGCATLRGSGGGDELAGRTLRMETQGGQQSRLLFRSDRTVTAAFGDRTLTGRWEVRNRNLCFHWPRAERECWPYAQPFTRGRTTTITSDRGNVVRVTLQ